MRLAKWSRPQVPAALAGGAVLTLILLALGAWVHPWAWAGLLLPAAGVGFTLYFFRDPERAVPDAPRLVVSPADGHVTHIEEAEEPAFLGGPALRISIFLSIFDVHLNRAPLDGRVAYVQYREGGFLNAMRSDSAASNEANDIGLETDEPRAPRVLVRQIAGLIARRIVCEAAPGASLRRGEVFGMIKFGSRTDLFLPRDSGLELRVKVGDAVRAGATVLGELPA